MTRNEEFRILLRGVDAALDRFYAEQAELFTLGVCEMCLVGHFYRFFHEAVTDAFAGDPELSIDIEYDRQGKDRQCKGLYVDNEYGKIRPDMVVHRRGNSSRNVCLFEFKRSDRKERAAWDIGKIKAATATGRFNYHFGCFIELAPTHEACNVTWFPGERALPRKSPSGISGSTVERPKAF